MRITIRLRYSTRFGQTLYLRSDYDWYGSGLISALPMRYVDKESWEIEIELLDKGLPKTPVSYYFRLHETDGSVTEDSAIGRKLDLASLAGRDTVVMDTWNDLAEVRNTFFTEPFEEVFLRAAKAASRPRRAVKATHTFNVKAPLLPAGRTLCLLGGAAALGGWDPAKAVMLQHGEESGCFSAQLDLTAEAFPLVYKYGVHDSETNAFVKYEDGTDRSLTERAPAGGGVIVNDGFARLPVTLWRGAGVAMPVFSLRGAKSFGTGEFLDLPLLVDWARKVGLKLIQLLPVNDTTASHTWKDSFPYAGISAFALHPLYLNLDRLAENRTLPAKLALQREELNALPAMDYEAVMKAKWEFIREIFPAQREKTFALPEYRSYFELNKHWLTPYAAFCCLRDKHGTANFEEWPGHPAYSATKIAALTAKDRTARDEMALNYFIQFHLHLQLREAADYAHSQGVILKGDIPIGVNRHSADVWLQPEQFHTDMQAGAPPDAFSTKGQNWGFPTYNWGLMKKDGFHWWKQRLEQMGHYFDAFRIDHILGFFRIWSTPQNAVEGILGYFVPALPVQAAEFAARGIALDAKRLTQPWINDAVLEEIFGENSGKVKRDFLNPGPDGTYSLKPQFAAQRDVEKYFARPENKAADPRLKEGLFDLISNVILFEAPASAGKAFHFRFSMDQTSSFRQLDQETRAVLRDLYTDYFYLRQDDCWRAEALEKLPALKRVTNMLICGEDLGMVPPCVPVVMQQLALLGLEIQRWPKRGHEAFSRPQNAPYLSVVSPGTHDMSTIRGWWQEDRGVTQNFFNQELGHLGPAPSECEPWISREIIRQHLASPAMLSIIQLQDLLGMDAALRRADIEAERINVPGRSNYYWQYRMHLPLEALVRADNFNSMLEASVRENHRA